MEPPTTRALAGSRPATDSAVSDFPEPDSPTSPSTSPRSMVRPTRSSAWIHRPPMLSSTDRSRISRIGAATGSAPEPRVEDVARPVADEVERERGQEDGDPGEEHEPGQIG